MSKNRYHNFLNIEKIKKVLRPRFSFHYISYSILISFIAFSVVGIVTATTPNPGHPWAEVGDGVFAVTNNQTATRTYTFPDANATVLTTANLVTIAQGGTNASSFTGNGVVVANAGGTALTSVINATGSTLCLTQVSSGTPTWGTCGGVTDGDKGDITVSGSGATWAIDPDVIDWADMSDSMTLDTATTIDLDGKSLKIQENGIDWVSVDVPGGRTFIQSYNPTGAGNYGYISGYSSATDGEFTLLASFNDGVKSAEIFGEATTSGSFLSYIADKHLFDGGNVGIGGDATPDALLSVGNTSQFQVNSSGNILGVFANATTDTDRFLVSDSGTIKYRTGTELLSDIGGVSTNIYNADGTLAGTRNVALNGNTLRFNGAANNFLEITPTSIWHSNYVSATNLSTFSSSIAGGLDWKVVYGTGNSSHFYGSDGSIGMWSSKSSKNGSIDWYYTSGWYFSETDGKYGFDLVNNSSNRLVGQASSTGGIGYVTLGTGLTLSGGVLNTSGTVPTPISSLTAAGATNTIDNANYTQEWQWNTLAGNTGLKLTSNSTAAAGNAQKLFEVALSGANGTAGQTTYGGYFSNAHTGSGTNVGLYAEATGGSTNYALQLNGDVNFTNAADRIISVQNAVSGPNSGKNLTIKAGNGGNGISAPSGGNLYLVGGSTADSGGKVYIYGGTGSSGSGIVYLGYNGSSAIGGVLSPGGIGVGSSAQFQVNSSGAIAAATGITSSGTINFSGLSASSAVYTDASKNLTTTAPTSGAIGYWSRTGTTLSPATANDILSVSTNSTTASNKAIEGLQTGATTGTDYAGYFSNTGAATTNVGLYATATGGTNNYAAIFDGGNVGIGTTTPAAALDVIKTTEQVRVGFDNASYFTTTVGSLSNVMYELAETSGSWYWRNGVGSEVLFLGSGSDGFESLIESTDGDAQTGLYLRGDLVGTNVSFLLSADDDTNPNVSITGDALTQTLTFDSANHIFNGNVGIGDTTPAALLTVGSGDLFQVNSSGNILGVFANATTDTDRFLVSDSGTIKYRTGAEILSDIGAQASGNYITALTGDITATGPGSVAATIANDVIDWADIIDSMTVDAATDINLGANAFTIDIDSTGDFSIRDVTTDIATFADSGAITFAPTSGQSLTNTLAGTGTFTVNSGVTTGTTTSSALALNANSLTSGTGLYAASSTLSSGSLVDLAVTGTAAASNTQKVLNVSTSGANATSNQSTYGGYFSNTHTGTGSENYGIYATAGGGDQTVVGVYGTHSGSFGIGVKGESVSDIGVSGVSVTNIGVVATTTSGSGLSAGAYGSGYAIYGESVRSGATTNNLKTIYSANSGTFDTTAGALNSYNGYFSNTTTRSAGANNLTNIGLYATASGAQNNYSAIFDAGNVGIGDTSPDDLLNISSASAQAALAITSLGTDTDALIKFELVDGTATFTAGVDDSDGDKFKISTTALGTSDRFIIDSSGNIVIPILDTDLTAPSTSGTTKMVITDANGQLSFADIAGGDITSVGDCTSGACFDGTQGTILTFNDADGDQTFAYDTTNNWFEVSDDFLPATNDALTLGANAQRWSDLFVGPSTIHIGTSTTDEGTISYNTASNIFNFDTDSTSNADIAFFTDDLYLDKSTGFVGIGDATPGNLLSVSTSSVPGWSGALTYIETTGTVSAEATLLRIMAPNITNGNKFGFVMGQGDSTYNEFFFQYNHVGNNSSSNYFSISSYGVSNIFTLTALGNASFGGSLDVATSLNVGTADAFQVNSSGAIAAATGITSSGTITFSGISGSTQCLQVNSSGVVSGTGSACGSGGSSSWNGITNPTGNQSLTFSTNTSSWTSALTTGTFFSIAADSLTTGTVVDINSASTAITSAGLFSLTASGVPASSWTGDLAKIEATGASTANLDGNLLKLGYTGTGGASDGTVLNITTTQTGTSAYALRVNDDGTYTDSTPFVIDASGNVGIGTTTATSLLTLVGNSNFSTSGTGGFVFSNTTASGSAGVLKLNVTSSSDFIPSAKFSTTQTATGALTASYGLQNFWTSSAVVAGASVGQNVYGIHNIVSKSGADTATGTYNLYGSYNTADNTGRTDTGTVNTYGGYFTALGDTAGASTAVGLYASASGADNNYAAIFDQGNVGIGTTAPALKFDTRGTAGVMGTGTTYPTGINFSNPSTFYVVHANNNQGLTIANPANNTSGATLTMYKTRGGDGGTKTAVVAGDTIGTIGFFGVSTDLLAELAVRIQAKVESVNATAAAGQLLFSSFNNAGVFGERMRLTADGNLNIGGNTSPTGMLSVGATSQFQVNTSGAIAAATGITSSGTINFSGLSASSAVYTDASKNLTTTAPTSGTLGYWSRTGTTLSPATANDIVSVSTNSTTASNKAIEGLQTGATTGTDYAGYFSNTGAATTNIGLYATATGATNNYAAIFEAGNVGIGTATPTTALDVAGVINTNQYVKLQNGSTDVGALGTSSAQYTSFSRNAYVSGGVWNRFNTGDYATLNQLYANSSGSSFEIYSSAPGANPINNWLRRFQVKSDGEVIVGTTDNGTYEFQVNGSSAFSSNVTIGVLDTDLTAPSTTGTTKMVITDANGLLSFTNIPTGGSGTVTNTGGNLTLNSVVLGAGTVDTKVSTGITTNGTAQLILGVNNTTLGTLKMFGNTSGDVTLQPTAAAGTATTQTLPATSGTLVNRVTTANGVSASNTDGALSFTLGAITPTTVNGLTLTSNATGFSIAGGTTSKTLTVSNSLTLAGTDSTTMTFPSTSATIARTDAGQTFTGTQTFSSAPTFSSISGSTQCLQVNSSGVVSGTGSACGAGGGGLTVGTTAITSGGANRVLFENGSNILSESANFTYDGTTLGITTASTTASNKALNISQTGATSGTDYAGYFSNTGAATTNVGLYATASGGTTNLGLNVDQGQTLLGGITLSTGTLAKLNIVSTMSSNGSGTAIAGIHGDYTFNNGGTAGYVQVGNRFVFNNAPTTNSNTMVGEIIRTVDNTTLANLVRGIEIVSNAGSNTAGTNTGLRSTGATFGVQAITSGGAGGVSLPAGLYAENTGTTQGNVARFYTGSMTSAPSMLNVYHDTSTFTGTGLLMDMAVSTGTFSGNFTEFKNASVTKFKVTSAGIVSMGLSGTASTNAVCSSLANATAPTAGTAYEIRDCNAAPAADYAEMYPVESGVEFGDIVATGNEIVNTYDTTDGNVDWTKVKGKITRLVKSTKGYQNNVIGIVVDNYGDFTSAGHNIKDTDNPMPVALNGRVPVKIASSSLSIEPGDYITTSNELGKGTKATKGGFVIGKALESWSPNSGSSTVMIYVEQGFYDGQSLSVFAGLSTASDVFAREILHKFLYNQQYSDSGSEILLDRLAVGVEIITPKVVADEVVLNNITSESNGDIGLIIGVNGKLTIKTSTSQQNPAIMFDSLGNATFTGTISAKDIKVGDISGIEDIANQINNLSEGQQAFALTAQVINTLTQALTLAQSDIVKIQNDLSNTQKIVAGLVTSGLDSDTRLKIIESLFSRDTEGNIIGFNINTLNISGDSSFTGKAQFDGLSFFSNTASFAGGVVFGGQPEFSVPPLYNKDSAGYALIKQGDKKVQIVFNQAYIATPVVNTSITFESEDSIDDVVANTLFNDDIRFIVVNKSQNGFTILLNKPATRDIRFSWNALSVKEPKVFESIFEGLIIEQEPTVVPIETQSETPNDINNNIQNTEILPIENSVTNESDSTNIVPIQDENQNQIQEQVSEQVI